MDNRNLKLFAVITAINIIALEVEMNLPSIKGGKMDNLHLTMFVASLSTINVIACNIILNLPSIIKWLKEHLKKKKK
ncbi:MAG: hypothetical protein NTX00_00265 [Candidatus Parcubacteria bacterium]|nr:hypothetical protein [Candidatus Parcubacteria bacterium]